MFRTELGDHVVVEPGAKLIGVKVAPGRYVPALALITTQEQADALPFVTAGYPYRKLKEASWASISSSRRRANRHRSLARPSRNHSAHQKSRLRRPLRHSLGSRERILGHVAAHRFLMDVMLNF